MTLYRNSQVLVAHPLKESNGCNYGWYKLDDNNISPEVIYGNFRPFMLVKFGNRILEVSRALSIQIRNLPLNTLENTWKHLTHAIPNIYLKNYHVDFNDTAVAYEDESNITYICIHNYIVFIKGIETLYFTSNAISVKVKPNSYNVNSSALSSSENSQKNRVNDEVRGKVHSGLTNSENTIDHINSHCTQLNPQLGASSNPHISHLLGPYAYSSSQGSMYPYCNDYYQWLNSNISNSSQFQSLSQNNFPLYTATHLSPSMNTKKEDNICKIFKCPFKAPIFLNYRSSPQNKPHYHHNALSSRICVKK